MLIYVMINGNDKQKNNADQLINYVLLNYKGNTGGL